MLLCQLFFWNFLLGSFSLVTAMQFLSGGGNSVGNSVGNNVGKIVTDGTRNISPLAN